jgi:ParB family chromosome partitioning protein
MGSTVNSTSAATSALQGAAMNFAVYPLRACIPSPANVRKKERTPADVLSMAYNIAAHGDILQNLIGVPEVKDGKRTGRVAITAGETRRLALNLLADGKVEGAEGFTHDFPVQVREVASEEATAASTSENLQRTPMHPADEFQAFADLYEQCGSIEQVAAMYHVKPLMVRQRLKLASAAPSLFAIYREDGMTLEQLMALSVSDDIEAQEKVWAAARNDYERSPARLRQALTQGEVAATAPLARFVGVANYEKAGGPVRRDLFSREDEGYLTDAALLRELAAERLERSAKPVRVEGWSWVEVRVEAVDWYDLHDFKRVEKGMRALTDTERDELRALSKEWEELDAQLDTLYEDEGSEDDANQSKIKELDAQRAKVNETIALRKGSYSAWTPEVLAHAGAIVAIDRHGKSIIFRGLVRAADRKAAAKAEKAAADAVRAVESGASPDAPATEPEGRGISEALLRRLTAHRTMALQRVLAGNIHVSLAVLAHSLVQRLLLDRRSYEIGSALDLQAKTCKSELAQATEASVEQSRAYRELKERCDGWVSRIPADNAQLLPWLIELSTDDLSALIALCTALTMNAVSSFAKPHPADAVAEAVGLDMRNWWAPSADEYLARVPKPLIAQALAEAGEQAEALAFEKMKKGEAVAKAADLLKGKGWLPAVLRAKARALTVPDQA